MSADSRRVDRMSKMSDSEFVADVAIWGYDKETDRETDSYIEKRLIAISEQHIDTWSTTGA